MIESSRYRPMTEKECVLVMSLARCRIPVNSADLRFVIDMAGRTSVTEKQAAFLADIAWRYRRQLPPEIRPTAKPMPSGTRRPNELAGVGC